MLQRNSTIEGTLTQPVNLVPVMEIEVHRQRHRGSLRGGSTQRESAQGENVQRESCLIILLKDESRYTRITLGFRSQGVEQFGREGERNVRSGYDVSW